MLKTYYTKGITEAGCDEAGRGCLAGPVFAASVILPENFTHPLLNDSKMLDETIRNQLRIIIENEAIEWKVAMIDNNEIDKINILQASIRAMHNAISGLKNIPAQLLIDGNRFVPYKKIPHQCIIKGDALFTAIAAASILAKTHRDEFMLKLHKEYPYYHWNTNKGYATLAHRKAIEKHGISPYHRKSFKLTENQLKMKFK